MKFDCRAPHMKLLYAANRKKWRVWLEKNHATEKEVWLVYYKKHTGKPSISYDEAVEEALCFGWIDSIVKKIDEIKYCQKFTLRKDKSKWSESNKKRIHKMIQEGRMTKAGLAKISKLELKKKSESPIMKLKKKFELPQFIKEAFIANKKAGKNFNNLAPSYQRLYIAWITSAKKEETCMKRLNEALALLSRNKKLPMK